MSSLEPWLLRARRHVLCVHVKRSRVTSIDISLNEVEQLNSKARFIHVRSAQLNQT